MMEAREGDLARVDLWWVLLGCLLASLLGRYNIMGPASVESVGSLAAPDLFCQQRAAPGFQASGPHTTASLSFVIPHALSHYGRTSCLQSMSAHKT